MCKNVCVCLGGGGGGGGGKEGEFQSEHLSENFQEIQIWHVKAD